MKIRRLGYACGAEVTGVDVSGTIDAATVAEIRRAWLEDVVLCFPGLDFGPVELDRFSRYFGELDDNRLTPHNQHPEFPAVMPLSNKPEQVAGKQFGGGIADIWHSDLSYTDRPSTATFLHAKILPSVGGETMFANMYLAYETLSPRLKELIEPLGGVHDVSLSSNFPRESAEVQAQRLRLNPPIVHPVVRTHPETGRKALYAGNRLRHFAGFTEEETKPILDFLNAHATRYEFVYRHRWRVGDLVMWDNRCALHYAVADYDPRESRRMLRCSLLAPKSGTFFDPAPARAVGV